MEEERYFKVSERDLKYFIDCRARLEALEAGGVDNWSGYCDSCEKYLHDMKLQYGMDLENYLFFCDIVEHEIKKFKEVDENE